MRGVPVDSSSWGRISPYLDRALELEAKEREHWLAELTTTQPQVADAVRSFLAESAALDASGFLAASPLAATSLKSLVPALEEALRQHTGVESADWLQHLPDVGQADAGGNRLTGVAEGAVLGAYRLIREIGHGGMSSVWLAERSDGQLKRAVALKLPYEGPPRAQLAERLQRERDILATLTHPNIARLYDAGVTPTGQPYLALEYVQGITLTSHCDAGRLSIRQRLQIFQQVLAAVEFAHEQLVLHRDLKPSNILVTEYGRVVLLDFGIAKLLTAQIDPEAPLTEMAGRILTPDYASPEHIAGRVLGTPSDIYSLGVVLCELLAGSRPFGSRHVSRQAFEEAILEQDPPKPSQLELTDEIAAARSTTPRKLLQILRGDLDTIVLKALKKAPAERYRSINAFAQDITNYLGNLPVSARPDTAWYRTRRFVSRHKLPVAAAAVTLLAIIGGAATSTWQARTAAQQRDRAIALAARNFALASRNAAVTEFMNMLITEAAASDKPITVSELLARSEQLALADTHGDGETRAAVLAMIATEFDALGDVGKSLQLYERALALVSKAQDDTLRSELICARALQMSKLDPTTAAAAAREMDREIDQLKPHGEQSTCLLTRAYIASDAGNAQETLRYATQGLQRFRAAPQTTAADEGMYLSAIADGYRLGGDHRRAHDYYRQALQLYKKVGRDRGLEAITIRNNWAILSINAGTPKHALELFDQTLSIVTERDPATAPPAYLIGNRARALELIGRYAEAQRTYELQIQVSSQRKNALSEAYGLAGLASIAQQSQDRIAAARYLRQLDRLLGDTAYPADSPQSMKQAVLRGKLDLADGKLEEARARFDEVLDQKKSHPITLEAGLAKAEAQLRTGDAAAAANDARTALDMAISLQGGLPHSNYTGLCWLMLGRALKDQHDDARAREAFAAAVTHLSNTVDADHPALVQARQLLADGR